MKKLIIFLFFLVILALTFGYFKYKTLKPNFNTITYTWVGEREYPSNQTIPWQWYGDLKKLVEWTPESDPDRDYNRGTVLLQKKFTNKDYWVNSYSQNLGQVSIVSPWWPSENQQSYISQGSKYFDIQTYTWWQYNDIYIMFNNWHTLPSVELINVAHKNGVKVYSLIMNPDTENVKQLVKKENNKYLGADKLIEIAKYYGFDGWFLNFETDGNEELAEEIRDFLIYFNKQSKDENIHLMWYDSWNEKGKVDYQNELNESNDWYFDFKKQPAANEYFINYWYDDERLADTKKLVEAYGRDPFEVHFGFETWLNYWNTGGDLYYPFPVEKVPHNFSLSLFQMNGLMDISSDVNQYYKNSESFYSGENFNPSNTKTEKRWKGVAHYYPAKSVINEIPFLTNFCTGNGRFFNVDGDRYKDNDWHNRSVQDIMPTWRWVVESDGSILNPSFTFEDSYYGGSCLKIQGDLQTDNLIKLFMTKLELTEKSQFEIAVKGDEKDPQLDVAISFIDNPSKWEFINIGSIKSQVWNLISLDISNYAGRTIGSIGVKIKGDKIKPDYKILVGRIGITQKEKLKIENPKTIIVDDIVEDKPNLASVKLKWDKVEDAIAYNIYHKKENSDLELLGVSSSNAFFISECKRDKKEKYGILLVESVAKDYSRSNRKTEVKFEWNTNDKPGISVNPNPMNGAKVKSNYIKFNWDETPGAELYEFNLITSDSIISKKTESSYIIVSNLLPDTKYKWTVNSINRFGKSEGETWHFSTTSNQKKINNIQYVNGIKVRGENSSNGEGKNNLSDENPNTKWLDFSGTSWIEYEFPSDDEKLVSSYYITSATDAPSRDPSSWILKASNNGKDWEILDQRKNQKFDYRNEKIGYHINNDKKFKYYKLELEAGKGNIIQIADIDLY